MEIIFFIVLGIIAGIICGLSPFVSPSIALLSLLFVLHDGHIISLLSFYVALITIIQYVGSVPAVILGIPGETSNLHTARIGHSLSKNGETKEALGICATSSLWGGFIGVLLFFIVFYFLNNFYIFYNMYAQIFFILLCFLILIFLVDQKWYINFFLGLLGYIIGSLHHAQGRIAPFLHRFVEITDPNILMGVPIFTVIFGLIVVPNLCKKINYINNDSQKNSNNNNNKNYNILSFKQKLSSVRGGIVGFFAGLLPGFSYVISSQLAYSFEQLLEKYYKHKKTPEQKKNQLAAAESANNAGGISTLIPFLFFGIPITISEGVLSNILVSTGQSLSFELLYQIFFWLMLSFIVANLVGFFLSLSFAERSAKFLIRYDNKLKIFTILMLLAGIYYLGSQNFQLGWYLICLIVFIIPGLIFRHIDFIPLILTIILQPRFESLANQIYSINF